MAVQHTRARPIAVLVAAAAVGVMGLLVPTGAGAATSGVGGRSATASQPGDGASSSLLRGKPGTWTKISRFAGNGSFEPGLLRTKDRRLHVVWPFGRNGKWGLGYSTISKSGAVVDTGNILSSWLSLQTTPKLVRYGNGVRLVFNGGEDTNPGNPFGLGARYTQTSPDGAKWKLVNGSLSSHTVFNTSLAATTQADGTPVSAEGLNANLWYHVGVDSATPSGTADTLVTNPTAFALTHAALVRDNKSNAIYLGWYQSGSTKGTGYYVKRILPASSPAKMAPRSSGQGLPDNSPRQGVALAARAGGGVYLAFCQPSKTLQCARVNLWKVGSRKVRAVPGSGTGSAIQVSLSAGRGGRLVVGWFDNARKVVRVVRTNTRVTAFGVVRTIKPPVKASDLVFFDGLFTESSSGRIDVVANVQRFSGGAPTAFYHTQVLPGLSLRATPNSVRHGHPTRVTLRVTDAGQAVAGAKVRLLGHTAKTGRQGRVSILVRASTPKGHYRAVATKPGYFHGAAKVTVR